MKALILAGGFGTRLRKVVYDRPKSMASIAGIPFLEHQIRFLRSKGITDLVLLVSYMADKIKSYFGNGNKFGVNITYSEDELPLGTAGAIKNAERYIDDTFLVLNGDSYSNIDFDDLINFHKLNGGDFTMMLNKSLIKDPIGAIMEGNKVKKFQEMKEDILKLTNGGIYVFEQSIFNYILDEKNISLEKEILPLLAKENKLNGYIYDGDFVHIGLPETYNKFRDEIIKSMVFIETSSLRNIMEKMEVNGVKVVFLVDQNMKLLGSLNEKNIVNYILKGGNPNCLANVIMDNNVVSGLENMNKEEILKLYESNYGPIPIINEMGILRNIEFYEKEVEELDLPIVRGRVPLKISFAGGGTDLPHFYEEHGGFIINATINKYIYATLIKRADSKILISSDTDSEHLFNSISDLNYDGKIDIIKAAIKLMKPYFGFEIHIHNDIVIGKGLGTSASMAVLIIKLLDHIMETRYDDKQIAQIAYDVERDALKRIGGWQDQYASIFGGFNFMEFSETKQVIYPLKLKDEIINELESHFILCRVGETQNAPDPHNSYEFTEGEHLRALIKLKKLTHDIRDALLTNKLSTFGRLLNETWIIKKTLDKNASNDYIDNLYDVGLKNGAYGGRLLGTKQGGYILFFYSPKKRTKLVRALIDLGGEIINFNFESKGVKVWDSKIKF